MHCGYVNEMSRPLPVSGNTLNSSLVFLLGHQQRAEQKPDWEEYRRLIQPASLLYIELQAKIFLELKKLKLNLKKGFKRIVFIHSFNKNLVSTMSNPVPRGQVGEMTTNNRKFIDTWAEH